MSFKISLMYTQALQDLSSSEMKTSPQYNYVFNCTVLLSFLKKTSSVKPNKDHKIVYILDNVLTTYIMRRIFNNFYLIKLLDLIN